MGQEAASGPTRRPSRRYQVNERVVAFARPAVVMHCLPGASREEITDAVLDGPQSVVLDQSENRLHARRPSCSGCWERLGRGAMSQPKKIVLAYSGGLTPR